MTVSIGRSRCYFKLTRCMQEAAVGAGTTRLHLAAKAADAAKVTALLAEGAEAW